MRPRDNRVGARLLMWLTACTVTLLMSGCGAVKIAYDHAETFAMFWIGRYVDLDSRQSELAQERIAAFIAWHRRTQLPDYVALATSMQAKASAGITAAEQASIEAALRERGYRALNRALPDLADMALALRPEQLVKTREKFEDNDREYRDKFIDPSPERRNRDRADLWHERIEYWYGDLDDKQRAMLDALSNAQPIDANIMLAERQSREHDAIEVLTRIARDKPSRGETIEILAALARRLETSNDPKRRAYLEALHASNASIFVAMSNQMTPAQRQNAVKRLGDWINDMKAAAAA